MINVGLLEMLIICFRGCEKGIETVNLQLQRVDAGILPFSSIQDQLGLLLVGLFLLHLFLSSQGLPRQLIA